MVAAAFRTIFAYATREEIAQQWYHVEDTLAERFPKAAALMRAAKDEVLAFSAFPKAHWRQVWSTNALERLNKELKRRCRVVGIFLRVSLARIHRFGGGRCEAAEVPRVTRNLSVELSALTLLGPVPSVPRRWPCDLIAA
jgi:hypothetical protein